MSQTGSIQGAKIGSYNNMNDPTYPGPDGKMFTWKRNVALHLVQTRLPKSIYEHIGLGSKIFDLPPAPYKGIEATIVALLEATIVATPDKKKGPEARGHYWIDSPRGEAIKRLCFTEDGALLKNDTAGTAAIGGSPPHERLRSRNSCHLQCCHFWCPRGTPAARYYPRATGGGPGGGLRSIFWRVAVYFVGLRSSFGVGGEQAPSQSSLISSFCTSNRSNTWQRPV
jgi:hypothetical protein